MFIVLFVKSNLIANLGDFMLRCFRAYRVSKRVADTSAAAAKSGRKMPLVSLSTSLKKMGLIFVLAVLASGNAALASSNLAQAAAAKSQKRKPTTFITVGPQKDGVILVLWNTKISDANLSTILEDIWKIGTRRIVVPFLGCQPDGTSNEVGSCNAFDTQFPVRVASAAQSKGFTVSFLPIVMTLTGEWRGTFQPTNADRWFETYGTWIKSIGRLSAKMNMPELVVGTEFGPIYDYEAQWTKLLQEVRREAFSGPLIVTNNWDKLGHSFWNEADAIGVSAYFPLSTSESPSDKELDAGAKKAHDKLIKFAKKWKRPIHITEIGFPSVGSGAAKPWYLPPPKENAKADWELQRRCYSAFVNAWSNEKMLAHTGIWAIGERNDWSYQTGWDIFGKPAEQVLSKFFTRR